MSGFFSKTLSILDLYFFLFKKFYYNAICFNDIFCKKCLYYIYNCMNLKYQPFIWYNCFKAKSILSMSANMISFFLQFSIFVCIHFAVSEQTKTEMYHSHCYLQNTFKIFLRWRSKSLKLNKSMQYYAHVQ